MPYLFSLLFIFLNSLLFAQDAGTYFEKAKQATTDDEALGFYTRTIILDPTFKNAYYTITIELL